MNLVAVFGGKGERNLRRERGMVLLARQGRGKGKDGDPLCGKDLRTDFGHLGSYIKCPKLTRNLNYD